MPPSLIWYCRSGIPGEPLASRDPLGITPPGEQVPGQARSASPVVSG